MKELQIYNYNKFNFHISVINLTSDSLHDEFRAEK